MIVRWVQLALIAALLGGLAEAGRAAPLPRDGASLVKALIARETRLDAFRELFRRTEPKDRLQSEQSYFNAELVVCPQETGEPIYIVLCDETEPPPTEGPESFGSKNLDRLFPTRLPAASAASPNERKSGKVMFAYRADGSACGLFHGKNLLEGYLTDVNQDGLMECVQATNYESAGKKDFEVLEVLLAVCGEDQPLFRAVINEGSDDWGWELRPENGSFVIVIGPKKESADTEQRSWLGQPRYDVTKVAAEFRWDKATHRYQGPAGSPQEHFLVLDSSEDIWQLLKKMETQERFPVLSSPTPSSSVLSEAAPETEPSEEDFAPGFNLHIPDGFWDLSPKQAALALVKANRRKTTEAQDLVLDDLDGVEPPKKGEVGLEGSRGLTILKNEGKQSRLIYSLG